MYNTYESPFNQRYASKEMLYLFSADNKFKTWRKLWIALAKAEKELGLNITSEQIEDMERYQDDINYEVAEQKEKEIRHDVMAHIHAFGEQASLAKPIIHLGATSSYVGDNTDILIIRDGLSLVRQKLINIIALLSDFAVKNKDISTLGFTHFQPAQLTTVGKRTCLWIQELVLDLEELDFVLSSLKMHGSKGTTGTQASFLSLFDNDHKKVVELDKLIAKQFAFEDTYAVAGQTYSRKVDSRVLNVLGQVAQSAYKFANDIRLLQSLKEIEEPFEKKQVGSSAMAYKRNPMRCERMSGLARHVIINTLNPAFTSSTQWFERTLDDSANRRISISEGFLGIDAILNIYTNVADGLVVYPKVINSHVMSELPFMATENILMEAVKKGGDRQELHEKIRQYSMEAGRRVKEEGLENNLIELICQDNAFDMSFAELLAVLKPENYVGRAPEQVEDFINEVVRPIIRGVKVKKVELEK